MHLPLELHPLFETFPSLKTKVVVCRCQHLKLRQAKGPSPCYFLARMTEVLQSGSGPSRMQVGLKMGGTHCLQLHWARQEAVVEYAQAEKFHSCRRAKL